MNRQDPSDPRAQIDLRIFVYGTLKRGFPNHDRYCRGVLSVEEAVVRGRLFETPYGFPTLKVSEEDVLAPGTSDARADAVTQASLSDLRQGPPLDSVISSSSTANTGWGPVRGELLVFNDPDTRLPAIDGLEEFTPGRPCLYRRVLVPARVGVSWIPAWTYVTGSRLRVGLRPLPEGVWH